MKQENKTKSVKKFSIKMLLAMVKILFYFLCIIFMEIWKHF